MLEGDNEIGWNNLVLGMVSIEDGAMQDLINLSLISWSEMKCLIHTEHLQLKSRVTIFSKLVELHHVQEKDKSASCDISWDPLCCFLPKAKATNKNDPSTSKTSQLDHTTSQDRYKGLKEKNMGRQDQQSEGSGDYESRIGISLRKA
ncbi:hypothetical protein K1719_023140 [Acacia pycnantha]|nr:hypothetical protein K1719_023140 [Acacia pycnantha]